MTGPTGDARAVVRLDGASVAYGPKQALRGVSLSLRAGEIYVLMGPNGSGKSTLVRLLAGLIEPCAGSVEVAHKPKGERVTGTVGLIPQDIALYPFLTARENCIAFGRIAGLGRAAAAAAADEALRVTACAGIATTRVSRLSGGYKRRVNIAVALVAAPRLLILDEPTAGVDAEARDGIAQTLSALRTKGTSILMITHDFDDAEALADRVGFLSSGTLVTEGEPQVLIAEAFGEAKRWDITFAALPTASQRALLLSEGAHPVGATSFLLFTDKDSGEALRFVDALETAGPAIKDLHVSAPGLQALYNRYCQTALAP